MAGRCSSIDRCEISLGPTGDSVAFSTFVLIETWLVPGRGLVRDRFGPRGVVIIGGILVAIAWAIIPWRIARRAVFSRPPPVASHRLRLWHLRRQCSEVVPDAAALPPASPRGPLAPALRSRSHDPNMIASDGYQHAFLFFGLLQAQCVS